MDAARWQRVNELFQAAIARASDERPSFLAEACAGDEGLQHAVDRLVRAHERAPGFLDTSVATHVLRLIGSPTARTALEPLLTSFRAGSAFRGTDRFAVRRRLGAGGMGMVYEAHDRARDELVALKTLLHARGADIYRLKREFRSLADVAHPNLVTLYELIVEDTECFFTMELVDGVSFVDYVRAPALDATRIDDERARRVFAQLVDGIGALHHAGKLHRDIKPSNILITAAERVVILDFGLTSDVVPSAVVIGESMAGTPAYLAPERHARAAPSESQDWYSVGVTLYEALTGRVPFAGAFAEVGRRKRECDPPPPSAITGDVPDDLDAICMGLLCRDPMRRLSGRDALRMLKRRSPSTIDAPVWPTAAEHAFVGRRRQLDALEEALTNAKQGIATTVYVHGPSGIGKSALVQHFLDGALTREHVVVLRGRCYERESVPYKALDGVIDSLSQYLRARPPSQAAALLPANVAALLRVFPVMLQVGAAAAAREGARERVEPTVLRQQAFAVLRDLLIRIAAQQPLVVYIDDLHWADADSAALLEEMLRPPQAPPILTVACFRAEEVASKPFLQALLERAGAKAGISLPLEPMSADDARALLTSALGPRKPVSDSELAKLAGDADGNPFLLQQLAGYLATNRIGRDRTTFAEMLEDRVRALPEGGRPFLETLAICGRPMAPEVVHQAACLAGDERPLVARLRAGHFLRASGSAERVELYHDRIRETLVANASAADKRRLHGSLARTLLDGGFDDPEPLYEHYREAGDYHDASVQAARAAEKADAALAFDRAAAYYRAALEFAIDPRAHRDWRERLATALANAGRPAQAADAYLKAAVDANPARRVELQRLAAWQLLCGGHIDRGLEVIRTVLRAVEVRLARGPTMVLASVLWRRVRLRWRGVRCVERDTDRVPPAALLKIDTCWSVATGLAMVDHVRATDFQTRHLLLALDAGDRYRVARGLAAEVVYLSTSGTRSRETAFAALARAEAMAARAGHPHAIALCVLARGCWSFLTADWPAAHLHCDRALTMLRDQPGTTMWELNTAQTFRLGALLFQGELRAGARELDTLMAVARDRGNLCLETELRTRMNLLWLAADHPDEGLHEAGAAMRQWSHAGFHRQHYNYMLDRIQTALYCGRARDAWEVIDSNWATMKRTHLLRMQFARIEACFLRGRCALLMAATQDASGEFLRIVRGDAARLRRENTAWSNSLACLLSAGVHALEGHSAIACTRLADAAAGFDLAHMKLYAAVARRRRGELAHDDSLRRRADEWMADQGIVNPARITRLIAPGFPDEPEAR